jgi:hypothetical protein
MEMTEIILQIALEGWVFENKAKETTQFSCLMAGFGIRCVQLHGLAG